MPLSAEKVPGGYRVDGLVLKSGKCGCTSLARCCYSLSRARMKSPILLEFSAKMTEPATSDLYGWGYTVRKDGFTVVVRVEDARDKVIYSGYYPPRLDEWVSRGWEVVEQAGRREEGALWRCAMCKWLYREDKEGRPFSGLPEDWRCPECGAGKDAFEQIG